MRRALALVAALVLLAALGSPVAGKKAGKKKASFKRYTYTNAAGARDYLVYVPSQLGSRPPLVVYLHGCTQTAKDGAIGTRFNKLAAKKHFVVVYPEQSEDANSGRCWNWFLPDHQHRDAGEPSLIAGITKTVQKRYDIDISRTFVNGISAGGAMSVVMAATYPELYAAMGVHAGCPYRGAPCLGSASGVPPETSGQFAYEEMGERARAIPMLLVQGDMDVVVPSVNADEVDHVVVGARRLCRRR